MTYAKRSQWIAGGLLMVLGACSGMEGADTLSFGDRDNPPANAGGSSSGASDSQSGAPEFQRGPTATGVVLVHAGAFPSFRLCFKNHLNLLPQPDSTIMPEANVVGVEFGSLVRIDPLLAPGTVYVINERETRLNPKAKCGDLLGPEVGKPKTNPTLPKSAYFVANSIDTPLGENQVHVLAITGCGKQDWLTEVNVDSASCAQPWNALTGNLEAKVLELKTTPEGATDSTLPIQMFHMAAGIDAFKGTTGSFDVTFGVLATQGKLAQPVTTGAAFQDGVQGSLALTQDNDAVYGAFGFRVTVTGSAGSTVTIDQSLATVQELSSSRELPTTYYRVASSYALLLLGDPAHKATLPGGEINPDYNARQAVHILAIPVLDPSKVDAGADDDAGGSSGSVGDGGS